LKVQPSVAGKEKKNDCFAPNFDEIGCNFGRFSAAPDQAGNNADMEGRATEGINRMIIWRAFCNFDCDPDFAEGLSSHTG
jgi:hypothetical protein